MAKRFDGVVVMHLRTLFSAGAVGGMSDGQLLERYLDDRGEGGRAAFGSLVERHGPMVLGICRRTLRDADESDDAFQATFLVLAKRAHSIRSRDALGAWLLGVARRVALRARGNKARRRDFERRVAEASSGESPASFEDAEVLIEEVNRLPERLREPVVLFYIQGQSYEGAAQALRTTEGTIRGRLARARDLLRVRLKRRGFAVGLLAPESLLQGILESMPTRLGEPTIRAATRIAAGEAISEVVSTSVATLMEGALKAMMTAKRITTALVIGLISLGVGIHVQAQQKPGDAPTTKRPDANGQAGPKGDSDIPTELLGGRVVRSAEVTKDCMVLAYLPDWNFGNVDNIGIANNDGGVRTLVAWPDVPTSEAKSTGLKFYLAFYSRKTTSNPKPGSIVAFDLSRQWPERTSWKTRPMTEPDPVLTIKFEPGDGWKLIDISSLVREREGKSGNGLMLRFLTEDRPGNGDWSGYQFVSREGQGEWGKHRPMLLVVEPTKK